MINLTKDPSGAPAVDLNKVREQHPELAKRSRRPASRYHTTIVFKPTAFVPHVDISVGQK